MFTAAPSLPAEVLIFLQNTTLVPCRNHLLPGTARELHLPVCLSYFLSNVIVKHHSEAAGTANTLHLPFY